MKGHVRIVHMNKINETTFMDDRCNETKFNILTKIGDQRMNNIIIKWDTTFQFYGNNCQHFATHCIKEIYKL